MTKSSKRRAKRRDRTPSSTDSIVDVDLARDYLSSQQATVEHADYVVFMRSLEERLVRLRKRSYRSKQDSLCASVMVDFVKVASSEVPGLPHQDKASHEFLSGLLGRVERAYQRIGVEPLAGTVIGTVQTWDWNALSAHFSGSTSLII